MLTHEMTSNIHIYRLSYSQSSSSTYCHVPEVESAHHVHEGEHDAGHDHEAEVEVAEHHQGHLTHSVITWCHVVMTHQAHRAQGQAQVTPELPRDDGVSLPGLVNLNGKTMKAYFLY